MQLAVSIQGRRKSKEKKRRKKKKKKREKNFPQSFQCNSSNPSEKRIFLWYTIWKKAVGKS